MMTPTPQMSLRPSSLDLRRVCSGELYIRVPH
jgi:hypothetical protein